MCCDSGDTGPAQEGMALHWPYQSRLTLPAVRVCPFRTELNHWPPNKPQSTSLVARPGAGPECSVLLASEVAQQPGESGQEAASLLWAVLTLLYMLMALDL